MRVTITSLALAAYATAVVARSATGDRILVVRESKYEKGYDQFFGNLVERGYDLTFATPKEDKAMIEAFGTPLYDHLILMAPETKRFSQHFTPRAVLDAQAAYLNTLYVMSPAMDDGHAALMREYDIEPTTGTLYDAFSYVGGGNEKDVVLGSSSLVAPEPILSKKTKAAGRVVYPSGTGFITGENPFLIDIVSAPSDSYIGNKAGEPVSAAKPGHQVKLAGSAVTLVAAMQNRANVRIGFVGSPDLLADKWWAKKLDGAETGNRAFLEDFTAWLFQETGVVRVARTHHYREGETEALEQYTKKDLVNYEIVLEQHSGNNTWSPVEFTDLQLKFTMLDPHILMPLTYTGDKYTAQFRAPDRHGVFKFVVDYFRPGWSYITSSDKASVVPLRHDEHPRFIVGAYPFYFGAISTSAAFLLFCAIWVSLAEGDKKDKGAKAE